MMSNELFIRKHIYARTGILIHALDFTGDWCTAFCIVLVEIKSTITSGLRTA
jgi:hypothetical protein